MGALVAAVSKKDEDVSLVAVRMLRALSHRGSDAFGLASGSEIAIEQDVEQLHETIESKALIGYCLAKNMPRDIVQPVKAGEDSTIAFEGRLFPAPEKGEIEHVTEHLQTVKDKALPLLQMLNGSYVFAMNTSDEIVVGRDSIGVRPLYLGENECIYAVASERKALWEVGVTQVRAFPPGNLAAISESGCCLQAFKTLYRPPMKRTSLETAAQRLGSLLKDSTRQRLSDVEEVAVAFSGGVDSSTIALLSQMCDVDGHLVHVALEGQEETFLAEQAAKALHLPLHQRTYLIDDVEKDLPQVIWLIENPSFVGASIAVPMFWVAKESARLGFKVLLAGQGADELFGGYHRYVKDFEEHGSSGLEERLYQDTVLSHESNFQRDEKVCASQNLEIRMPFADWEVIHFALSLPAKLKIFSTKDGLRKRVLRQTAKQLGVPRFIAERPKKAIQYSTGMSRAMKRLSKRKGSTLREYLEATFLKAFDMRN